MHEGNWKCSSCGGAITQLPFLPRGESGLTCRSCYGKGKEAEKSEQPVPEMQTATEAPDIPDFDEAQVAGEPMSADEAFAGLGDIAPASPDKVKEVNGETRESALGQKSTNAGNWTCSGCGGAITSLPFVPRNTSNLKCLDCFKSSKG